MQSLDVLRYAYDQIPAGLRRAAEGLDEETLTRRPGPGANTIAWLVWHAARVQDDHVAEVGGHEQVWTADGWVDRFGLPFDASATGYGFTADDVAQVRAPADLLLGYADAVHARTDAYLQGLSDTDLDRVLDSSFDPPVTLGVRLVSVLQDDLMHAGQAAYVRGLLDG